MESDEALALAWQERAERSALEELVRRHERAIHNYLLRLLRDPHEAEEAAQQAFLRMLRGFGGYRPGLPFRAWLYRIALNTARTWIGRSLQRPVREAKAAPPGGNAVSPDEAAARREVQGLVDELPEDQREAVLLHYFEGLSHAETAAALDIPPGTVATRIHQALQSLRTRMAAIGILAPAGGVEQFLQPTSSVPPPASILSAVRREASGTAPPSKGAQPVVAAVSILVSLGIGGWLGYRLHPRAEPPSPIAAASARAPDHQDRPKQEPERASVGARPAAEAPAAPVDPPKPAAPPSKHRKLAAAYVRLYRAIENIEDPRNPRPEEGAKILGVLGPIWSDPEVVSGKGGKVALLNPGAPGDESFAELLIGVLEELGTPPSNEVRNRLLDHARRAAPDAPGGSTSIEKRTIEVRREMAATSEIRSILGELNQPAWEVVEGVEMFAGSGGMGLWSSGARGVGFLIRPASWDESGPRVAAFWKERMKLDPEEIALVTETAAVHARRLWSLQEEIRSTHGNDFMAVLTEQFDHASGKATSAGRKKDPELVTKLKNVYLRLLEAELEARRALMALLPAKAESIAAAPPYVYLMDGPR
jgi:RNA polymerase sigma-70 factor (ECF subfamily)